jgi:hypothetical protein
MVMIEELKNLFKFVKSEDREISELYLKLVLDKYKISIVEDYVFIYEPTIIISNNIIVGVKSISINFPYLSYLLKKVHYFEYDTRIEEFLDSRLNPLNK